MTATVQHGFVEVQRGFTEDGQPWSRTVNLDRVLVIDKRGEHGSAGAKVSLFVEGHWMDLKTSPGAFVVRGGRLGYLAEPETDRDRVLAYLGRCERVSHEPGRRAAAAALDLTEARARSLLDALEADGAVERNEGRGSAAGYRLTEQARKGR